MNCFTDKKCLLSILVIFYSILCVNAQHRFEIENKNNTLTWCTTSLEEKYKCGNFSMAVERDRTFFAEFYFHVACHHAFNVEECIQLIYNDNAQIMSLDAGEIFIAGRHHSLIPIMRETYEGGFSNFFSVAVVKKNTMTDVTSLQQLRGKKACFAGVETLAGWMLPIYTLQIHGGMEIIDCNNHVKNAINFFGESCAVNSLLNRNNPIGDNSDKLCALCTGKVPGGRCNAADPYAGYEGAFRCLLEAGEIAFLKDMTVHEMLASKQFQSVNEDRFELFCTDGSRKPLHEYRQCNWGSVPANALVISSGKSSLERRMYQEFIKTAIGLYAADVKTPTANTTRQFDDNRFEDRYNPYETSRTSTTTDRYSSYNNRENRYENNDLHENGTQLYEKFEIFESERYGGRLNLMFQDAAERLVPIREEDQLFEKYLGKSLDVIFGIRQCPVGRMVLCVTSDAELRKCAKMVTALKAQLIKPEMICYKAHSQINCMQAVQSGVADVTVLDASDVYTAGLRYELIPFMSEIYSSGKPEYYVVAVAKEQDATTEITYLRGKRTCHTGINTAAGWVYPMAYLISNGWIRPYGCDSVRAAAEYFSKSCIPGALSTEYNIGLPYDNLCHLCHGSSYRFCRRDASEDYYGHSGAMKCLVEGGGDVAFVKHSTVAENTGGKNKEWWARNLLPFDFELLCPDGTRAYYKDYKTCNLGKVKANAIVTRGGDGYSELQLSAYINLFVYAQQLYGRQGVDEFSFNMYYSESPHKDLIFQDETRKLEIIPRSHRRYDLYLGKDFMRARRITDCYAGANSIKNISYVTILTTILVLLFGRY